MPPTSSDERCTGLPGRPLVDLSSGAVLAYEVPTHPLGTGSTGQHARGAEQVPVLEVTGDDLRQAPAALLDLVDAERAGGARIALGGLGTSPAALALMPFLRPEVLKVDLRLAQQHRGERPATEVVNAVTAEAAVTGALVVAERLETPEQALLVQSMGICWGQGPLVQDAPGQALSAAGTVLPVLARPCGTGTPWEQRPPATGVRVATKRFLLSVSRWLEEQAAVVGEPAVVLTSLGHTRRFSSETSRRYAALGRTVALVGVLGHGVGPEPAHGVRGVDLDAADPLVDEWVVIVVGPHFAGALLASDLHDSGPDLARRFEYVVTYDRQQVLCAAEHLLRRLPPAAAEPGPTAPPAPAQALGSRLPGYESDPALLLTSALAGSSTGLCICDAGRPDLPLVYVNAALEQITGYQAAELLGRNPRFLQGGVADPEAVATLSRELQSGQEVRATLRQRRRDGGLWWNEMSLLPVRDHTGEITHWVGTANDVTRRVEAEQQVAHLARHDPLTGLANRRHLADHLRAEIGRAGRHGGSVALLFLDLDGFKEVNDRNGHGVGDQLLVAVADRLRDNVRVGDLLVRQGGDEFLLVLSDLPADVDAAELAARDAADKLRGEMRRPFLLDGQSLALSTSTSIGVSLWPHDAEDAGAMLDHADGALYQVKASGQDGTVVYRSLT